jgi:hypothetical protein
MKKSGWALMALIVVGVGLSAVPGEAKTGPGPIVARMTLTDGSSRTVTLEGVGCSETMCSRVAVRSKADGDSRVTRTWLDAIATIKDITSEGALFVLKNGTSRRLSVVHDNQFLYFADQDGAEGKIFLAGIKSVEFLAQGR